jgi:hypothetical protein
VSVVVGGIIEQETPDLAATDHHIVVIAARGRAAGSSGMPDISQAFGRISVAVNMLHFLALYHEKCIILTGGQSC